jgi:DNA polymerase-3 subunit delta'
VRVVPGPLEGKRDISIEQVRELQRELGFRSLSTHPKVGIVDDAHLLTVQAQNALLKTLEEPNGESVLVLVAVQASALLPTILSRCQRVELRAAADADRRRDPHRGGRSAAEARALATYANGSPGPRSSSIPSSSAAAARAPRRARGPARRRVQEARRLRADAGRRGQGPGGRAGADRVVASRRLRRAVLGPDAELQNADLAEALGTPRVGASLRNLETTYATMRALRQNANRNLTLIQMLMRLE